VRSSVSRRARSNEAKAGGTGKVSPREQRRIQRDESRDSRRIHEQKKDEQTQ